MTSTWIEEDAVVLREWLSRSSPGYKQCSDELISTYTIVRSALPVHDDGGEDPLPEYFTTMARRM